MSNNWLFVRWLEVFASSYALNENKKSSAAVGCPGISKKLNSANADHIVMKPYLPDPFLEAWRHFQERRAQ